jgi:hypothetical protein
VPRGVAFDAERDNPLRSAGLQRQQVHGGDEPFDAPHGGRGNAGVNGFDVAWQAADVHESISLTGQSADLDELLSGRENLVMPRPPESETWVGTCGVAAATAARSGPG